MKFSKMLEMSTPIFGDCKTLDVRTKRLLLLKKDIKNNFIYIKKIKDLYLYRLSYKTADNCFVFVLFERGNYGMFYGVYQISLFPKENIANKFNLKNLSEVKAIFFYDDIDNKKYKNQHYPYLMYSEILNQGYNLLGDSNQFDGARKIWHYLSKDYKVDIVKLNGETIHSNVQVNISKTIETLDKRIYNYDNNTRLLAYSQNEKIIKEEESEYSKIMENLKDKPQCIKDLFLFYKIDLNLYVYKCLKEQNSKESNEK